MTTILADIPNGTEIPLFPLNLVLCPDVPFKLQIFEQRYLSLVRACMKSDTGFGVVGIREGREVGAVPLTYGVGVYVAIIDWFQHDNGLLGLVVKGTRKFRVCSSHTQADQLLMAEVDVLPDESDVGIGDQYDGLIELLAELKQHPMAQTFELPEVMTARELGWQLTQLLPLSSIDKVALIEMADPEQRLNQLALLINNLITDE